MDRVASNDVGSISGRASPLERHDKGSRTGLGLQYTSVIPALGAKRPQLHAT